MERQLKFIPVSVPFTECTSTVISGITDGGPNYCNDVGIINSKYHLNEPFHNNFVHFEIALSSGNKLIYCIDRLKKEPTGEIFKNGPFEEVFPEITENLRYALDWLLANTFPSVSAEKTFEIADVDALSKPVLDENDAYAMVQSAIWYLMGSINESSLIFINCKGTDPHLKSKRLAAGVLHLVYLAEKFGIIADTPVKPNPSPCGCHAIECCNINIVPQNPAEPYITLTNCPDEISYINGCLWVGPFILRSNVKGIPSVNATALCGNEKLFSVGFTDEYGEDIINPEIGKKFYMAIRADSCIICINLFISIQTNITKIIYLNNDDPELQRMGGIITEQPVYITSVSNICICVPLGLSQSKVCPVCKKRRKDRFCGDVYKYKNFRL